MLIIYEKNIIYYAHLKIVNHSKKKKLFIV